MEGIFCLGMVWKMDPLAMPGRFCMAQSVLMALGSYLMTGVICVSSYITHKIVLKPKTWADQTHEALTWRISYALPTILFPIAALAVQVALVVKLKSVRPAIEFYCDSSSPQWVRFLSYAGTPFLLFIPSLFLSVKSILAVQETERHIQRARSAEFDTSIPGTPPPSRTNSSDGYTQSFNRRMWSLKSRRELRKLKEKQSMEFQMDEPRFKHAGETSSASSLRFSMSAFASNPRRSSKGPRVPSPIPPAHTVHFRIPTKPSSSDTEHEQASPSPSFSDSGLSSPATLHAYSTLNFPESSNDTIQIGEVERASSPSGSLFFRPTGDSHLHAASEQGHATKEDDIDYADVKSASVHSDTKGDDASDSFELGEVKTVEDDERDGDDHTLSEEELGTMRVLPKVRTHTKEFNNDLQGLPPILRTTRRPTPPSLPCEIWRLILFQITFIVVQVLGSLSTLVDIARRHPVPSPLGTHHFSLLFAAWGPVMFFGSLRSIRGAILPQRTPRIDS